MRSSSSSGSMRARDTKEGRFMACDNEGRFPACDNNDGGFDCGAGSVGNSRDPEPSKFNLRAEASGEDMIGGGGCFGVSVSSCFSIFFACFLDGFLGLCCFSGADWSTFLELLRQQFAAPQASAKRPNDADRDTQSTDPSETIPVSAHELKWARSSPAFASWSRIVVSSASAPCDERCSGGRDGGVCK